MQRNSDRGATKSREHLIGGAILLATGAALTITGIGAIIGIPLGMLGFGVMFPKFTKIMIGLSAAVFLLLLLSL